MLQLQSPFGKFISLSHQDPNFLDDSSLSEKLENFIDLIKYRIQNKGIEQTSQSLQNELFEIRIELISLLFEKPAILKKYEKIIIDEITKKYYITGLNKKLGQTIADTLEVYFKVFSSFSGIFAEHINKPSNTIPKNEIPTLNGLKFSLSLQPSKEVENYIVWLEASLNFDYALIVSDLIFHEELQLKRNEISDLEAFAKRSIIEFASYSVLTGLWQPDIEDESYLIRNIKIKSAILELENGRKIKFSKDELHEFITN